MKQLLLIAILGIFFTTNSFSNISYTIPADKIELNSISVYPNPIKEKGILQLKLENTLKVKIELFDMSGKRVKEIQEKSYLEGEHKIEFKTENLNDGIYIIKVSTEQWIKAKRIVINR